MKFYKKFHSLSLSKKQFFNLAIFCVLVFSFFINFSSLASAATGVPKVINFQGRLMDSSGNLLGGPTGTNYCYRFSIYSATTGGTKLWPAGTPSTMTILTREGVFDAPVGDVSAGGDSLTYDFQTSDTTFMNVEVNTTPGTCSGTWESLSPRPQIVSAAYAINSGTVQGLAPTQSASGNQLPQLTSDALVLGGTSAGVKSTSTNALTFNAGASGDVQFFSSANKITSGGALTIAGLMTSAGLTSSAPVNVTSQSATALTVARTGTNYALQVDTNTASSVTGLKVTSAAAGGGLAISVISSGTDENLTIDAKGAGTISIGGNSTGDVLLAGGVGSTGCTITNSTGALSCTAGITATALPWNSITNPTGNQSLSFGTNTSTWTTTNATGNFFGITANSITTGQVINIGHTTSVIANGGSLLKLSSSSVDTSTTTGTLLDLSSTASTAGTLALITNNTASFAGKTLSISSTGITTGRAFDIGMGTTLTTGGAINVSGASYAHGVGQTGSLVNLSFSDASSNSSGTSISNGINIASTVNTNGIGSTTIINAFNVASPTFTACGNAACTWNGLNVSGNTNNTTGLVENAINIAAITGGSATENAINVGSGWDTILKGTTAGTNLIDFTNFKVSSAGVVSALTGLSSSGTINFSGLTASSAVYTDASKNLTTTAPTSGTIGYWSRSGTTLSPATANDIVSISTNSTTASNKTLEALQTGATTGTDYAGYFSNTGAATTNVGLYTTASGGTNNYSGIFDQGNVGIGTTTPTSKLHLIGDNGSTSTAPAVLTVLGGTGSNSGIGTTYNGGLISLTTGTGGASTSATASDAGNGGAFTIAAGAGGNTSGSGSQNGGIGGSITISAGAGGNSTNFGGGPGAGGSFTLTGGNAGNATSGPPAVGGSLTLTAGNGATGGVGGAGGDIILNAGSGSGNGRIILGNTIGNVTVGSTTSTSMFNVGTSAQFQVTSAGVTSITPGQSATALTVARTGTNYAFQVDTNTASSATGLKVTSAAAGGGLALTTISSGTDENVTFDAKGAGTISIGGNSTGDVLLAGGVGSTGCTITNSTGALSCTAGITASAIRLDQITAATTSDTDNDNLNNNISWAWSTATTQTPLTLTANGSTTGSILSLTSSSAAATTGQKGLNVALTGALTGAQTTYGGYFSNTRTGASAVNVGLYATASGATGGNYAAIFDAGNVGIGTAAPQAQLEITGNFRLADQQTDTNASNGIIYKDGTPFIHNFRHATGGGARPNGNNTFVGLSAGNLTMGSTATLAYQASNNSGFGYQAFTSNTTGYYNSAFGLQALYSNTTGYSNSAFGMYALKLNDTGYSNSAFGIYALERNTSGYYNAALGYFAGGVIADGSTSNQTSNTSVYLGSSTKALADGDTNEIVLGYNTTGFGSNTAAYGNSSITKHVFQTGNVGIGDTTPDQLLEILSSGAANTQFSIGNTNAGDYDVQIGFELSDGTNTFTMGVDDSDADKFKISTTALGTSDRFVIDSSGNVTIPDLGGGGTLCVQTDNNGTLSTTTCGGGGTWDTIGNPAADQNLTFDAGEETTWTINATTATNFAMNANALTSGTILSLTSNGTGALTGQKGLNISLSGANGTGAQTTYGAYISNTHTGASATSVGLYATASGGQTNYAAQFAGGIFQSGGFATFNIGSSVFGVASTTYPDYIFTVNDGVVAIGDWNGPDLNNTYLLVDDTNSIISANASSGFVFGGSNFELYSTTASGSGLLVSANSLTTGKGVSVESSSITSGALMDLTSTGTGALTGQKGLNISLSGTNGTGAQTTYGAYISNTKTGTSNNVGLYATASGGTNNYAAIFESGEVLIGSTTDLGTYKLQVTGDSYLNGTTTVAGNGANGQLSVFSPGGYYYPQISFYSNGSIGASLQGYNNALYAYTGGFYVSGGAVFNDSGADADFRIEGDTEQNLLFVDASTDRIGIGTATPVSQLTVKATDDGNATSYTHTPLNTALRFGTTDADTTSINNGAYISFGRHLGKGIMLYDNLNDGTIMGMGIAPYSMQSYLPPAGSYQFTWNVGYQSTLGTSELMRLTSAGELQIGSTTDLGPYRLQVTKADTGQTANASVSYLTNSGATFNTTSGALVSYGEYISSISTRSSGSNTLTNIGLYTTASGGQRNSGGVFEASYSAASSLQGNVGVSGNLIMTGNNAYASSGATGGVSGIVTLDSSADYTYTLGHIIAGVVATGYANGSGTTADKLAALKARTIVNNSAAVTDFYSVLVDSPDMSVSGTITNQYGVYIGDQKPSGVTNSFGIYQGGTSDINYFAGETRIGSTTDLGAYPLQVTGNAYVTSQIDFGSTGTGQGSLYKSGTAAILASTGTLQLSAGSGNRVQILVDNGARRAFYTTDGKFLFGGGSGETYGGIGSDNGTGALVFYYDDSSNSPNEAARFSSAGLFSTINNTITDTNSLFDLNLTLGNDATADTISALNIDVTSTATGADGDILYGINVANLTSADADVAESAIRVGTGWDNIFTSANASLTQAGALTVTSCTGCGGGVTADSLDFTDFSDTMTLDASTDINLGANAFTIDLDSTGDFSVRDGTTDFALFDDTGGITFAPNGTSDFTLTLDNDSSFIQNATVTDSGFIQDINLVLGDDAAIDTVTALNIDVTSSATGDADTLRGLTLSVSSADATVVEEGLVIGSGWDTDIRFLDTTPEMALADNGTLILSDGSSTTNDIFQIGTATSRGNALVYGDLVLKGGTITRNLTGIIDVFVYDTAGDSDSGDWRNSLEYLQRSWATETKDDGVGDACNIATDDRCGGAAFPRKAILVTTASALYIFDASDNSLWMKFTQSGTYALGADTNNNPSGVAAQNGVIVVGTNGSSATGMYAIDFKQDAMYRYNTTDRSQADNNIGNRNSTTTYSTNSETGFAIINNTVNDVSINMQTASMENRAGTLIAPVDSQGGPLLGVTLIAAATDSGVSVINMGTRKVVSYSDATNDDYNQVYITKRGRMYATNETRAQLEEWRGVDTVITAQTNGTPTRWYDETLAGNTPITLAGAVPTISTSPSALAVIERASAAREAAAAGQIDAGDVVFVGTDQGLAEVHTSGGTLANASWSKITTKDDATPYMNGGIRSVYLFDDAAGATSTNSAVGATGSTRNPMDTAGATSPTFGANGIRGGSVNFNNNSYLCSDADANGTCDSDTDNNVSTTSFTVSMWFKHGTTAAADVLFERCYTPATPTAATGCVFAGMNTTGNIVFGIDDDATWTTVGTVSMDDAITSSGTWNDNQWHHLLVTNTDTDICMYIDGRQAVACDTALAATATLDNAQVLTIGGRCTGANCVTGDSFWDGEIDEFTWSAGATTSSGSVASAANKRFLDGRTHLIRPQTSVTNADIGSSTTIGSSSQSYVPNSFAGLVVEITGGTGAGQTRNIISNTATTFTVYPAWSTTPDSTSDFRVSPSKLYGSTNTVTAIAVDAPTQINRVRNLYVGTNDGSDGGGVSVFTNAGAGGIKTEVYSSDSGIDNDDFGTAWSGTDADDINAIASFTDTIVFGTGTGLRSQRKDLSLKQMQADMFTAMDDIRSSLVASGLFGATQEVLGLGQGADLAEYYYSNTPLEAGDVVAIQPDQPAGIGKSTSKYQKNLLGVVSTKPGLTLGPTAENAYPIALSGRIPVKVTDENGIIKVGDLLTSSSRPGYAMRATSAGPIIGRVLNEPDYDQFTSCDAALPEIATTVGDGPGVTGVEPSTDIDQEIPEIVVSATGPKCGYVMLFAGLGESLGKNVEILAAEYGDLQSGQATIDGITTTLGTQSSIMSFLRASKADLLAKAIIPESIFSDRIAAGMEILTPTLYADDIYTKTITALDGGSVALIIGENGKFEVRKDESTPATITLDALGNAVFSGKVTAAEIDSAKITGFDALIERITALETLLQANAFDSLTSVTTQNLKATGDSSFEGKAQFAGLSFFSNTTTFDGGVVFGAPVEFNLPPIFNKDTAGFAIIKEGARKVEVVFNQPYIAQPVTSASISLEDIIVPATEVEPESIQALSDSDAQAFLDQGISYIITNKTTKGFTIRINKNAPRDIRFSWTAFAVKDPSIFESIVDGLIINPPVEENTPPEVEEGGGNSEGEEENPPIDICPNIEGEQTVMLEGYQVDIDGNCTTITQEGGGEEDPAPIPEEPDPIPDTTPEPTPTIIEPPSDQEGAPTV